MNFSQRMLALVAVSTLAILGSAGLGIFMTGQVFDAAEVGNMQSVPTLRDLAEAQLSIVDALTAPRSAPARSAFERYSATFSEPAHAMRVITGMSLTMCCVSISITYGVLEFTESTNFEKFPIPSEIDCCLPSAITELIPASPGEPGSIGALRFELVARTLTVIDVPG